MDNKKKNRSPLKNPLLIFLVISVIATVIFKYGNAVVADNEETGNIVQ